MNVSEIRAEIDKREAELVELRRKEVEIVKAFNEEKNRLQAQLDAADTGSIVVCGKYVYVKRRNDKGRSDWAWLHIAGSTADYNSISGSGAVAFEAASVGEENYSIHLLIDRK